MHEYRHGDWEWALASISRGDRYAIDNMIKVSTGDTIGVETKRIPARDAAGGHVDRALSCPVYRGYRKSGTDNGGRQTDRENELGRGLGGTRRPGMKVLST